MKKVNVVKVAMLGVLSALAVVLMFFVRFPILPIVPFMEYDPGDVVGLIAGFLYGPVEGLIVIIIVALIQGMTVSAGSGWVGIAMHI
jgi:riboflavin transporter FmnP